jgi:hypothetical protein
MDRRRFLWVLGGTWVAAELGCKDEAQPMPGEPDAASTTMPPMTDAATTTSPDACTPATVKMHDTYAQALYLDGTYGPLTGTITVQYVLAGAAITLDFWHGHGGIQHRYTLEPQHFAQLKAGQRVTLPTTIVEDHMHTLFIDPLDEHYRVPGAPNVDVPLDHC